MRSTVHAIRAVFVVGFCLVAATSLLAGTATGPQCVAPPPSATWEQILPCVQDRKNVKLLLSDGTELRGKLKRDGSAGCAKGEWCAVRIGSVWRGYKPVEINRVVAVSFHRHMSGKRKLAATAVGIGAAIGATAWLLDAGFSEAMGALTLGYGVMAGVVAGVMTADVSKGRLRMVRIVDSSPAPAPVP
jgi:hypothetical protein